MTERQWRYLVNRRRTSRSTSSRQRSVNDEAVCTSVSRGNVSAPAAPSTVYIHRRQYNTNLSASGLLQNMRRVFCNLEEKFA